MCARRDDNKTVDKKVELEAEIVVIGDLKKNQKDKNSIVVALITILTSANRRQMFECVVRDSLE